MNPQDCVQAPGLLFNLAAHLLNCNAARPNKVAFADDNGTLTYYQLSERVRKLAAGLKAIGIRREERVLLLMHDCNDWPVSFLGAIYAGIVPVAVNTLLTPADYAFMLSHSRAQAVLVSAALLPALRDAMSMTANEVTTIIVSGADSVCLAQNNSTVLIPMDELINVETPLASEAQTGPDDPGFWLYSSGSTGRPKGVLHSQANPYWTAELYGKAILGLTESDVCFSAAKLYFAYGLGNALTFPLSVGATVVLMAERPTPEASFKRITEQGVTVFFGAPTGYAALLASPSLPARDQVALRLCSSAGEALPADIGERFTRHFGCEIVDGIGSTEMLHIFLSNRPGDVRYGTTGRPVPGYAVELRGEEGHLVPTGEIGDLYIQGPSAALLYWGNREKSRDTFRGDWTKSGKRPVNPS